MKPSFVAARSVFPSAVKRMDVMCGHLSIVWLNPLPSVIVNFPVGWKIATKWERGAEHMLDAPDSRRTVGDRS